MSKDQAQNQAADQDQKLAEVTAKLEAMEAALVEKEEEVTQLQEKVTALEEAAPAQKAPQNAPVVKLGKTSYAVVSGTWFGGKKYTREELAKEKAILTKMVDAGTTIVVPV